MNTRDVSNERMHEQAARGQRLSTADLARAGEARPDGLAAGDGEVPHARMERPNDVQPLFPAEVSGEFRTRWTEIQTGFVDTPRESVEHADELVADAIKRLAESFAHERARLEEQWARNGDVSTEDLRVALQRYRTFFQRLLQV